MLLAGFGFLVLTASIVTFAVFLFTEDAWSIAVGFITMATSIGVLAGTMFALHRRQSHRLAIVQEQIQALGPGISSKDLEPISEDIRRLGDFWAEVSAEILGRLEGENMDIK